MTDLVLLVDKVIGPVVAAVLTVMVLSYLIGDNPLFRIATHVFVGVAAGYAGALALRNVLVPGLVTPLASAGLSALTNTHLILTVIVPWLLVGLLLFKLSASTARLGSLPVAFLVGVGAAVVVGGAITGTLIPQSAAAMNSFNPTVVTPQTGETGLERMVNVGIMLLGTLSALAYFRFATRNIGTQEADRGLIYWLGRGSTSVGRLFIAVTFAVMYAGAIATSIIVLSERVQFIRDVVLSFLGPR
jgi:hypothetical protein